MRLPNDQSGGAGPREQAAQLHGGRELATMIEDVADRGGIFLGDNEHVRKHGSADHDQLAGFDVPQVLRIRRRQLRPHRDEAKRAALLLVALLSADGDTGNKLLVSVEPVTGAEPLRAFPSRFLRIVCERCGKERMISETHMAQGDMLIRDILDRTRHDGCGGRGAKAELLTAIDNSSRPVRRIVLRD